MKITVTSQPLEDITAQALIVIHEPGGLCAETQNAALASHLQTFARDVEAKVSKREWFCTLEKSSGCRTHHLLLESVSFSANAPHDEPLKMTAARCVALCREYSLTKLAIAVHHPLAARKAATLLEGILLGDFRDMRYKGKPEPRPELQLTFVVPKDKERETRQSLDERRIILEAQNNARLLVNTPHHDLTPADLAEEAQALAKRTGMRCTVLTEKQLRAKGYEPTYQVGRGSEYPPRLITLHWQPAKPRLALHLCLVGKGMTYDSGGLCIKGRDSMYKMNADMGGAAAVLGAMEALARMQFPGRVTAVIASAHNAVDGAAYHPGCIFKAKNGKTIHVENTDAEGRLILTDCFARAAEEKPDIMIDFATLTGSASAALGASYAALFSDDIPLRTMLLEAGRNTGDELWSLPLCAEYESSIRHHLADLNNMSSDKNGGAIHAANFLKQFVPEGIRWAHIDMAGTATTDRARRYFRPGATGYGVRLAIETARMLLSSAD
jgi:leucyl aminopeptidase